MSEQHRPSLEEILKGWDPECSWCEGKGKIEGRLTEICKFCLIDLAEDLLCNAQEWWIFKRFTRHQPSE